MPDKSAVEKLIDRAPLAIIIIGVLVFVIGAAGGLPVGNPPLQVTDFAWRAALGAMGLILTVAGLLLLSREGKSYSGNNSKTTAATYNIKINSPTQGQRFKGGEGNLIVEVSGTYRVKPPLGTTLRLFVKTENGYWRQEAVVDFDNGYWRGRIGLWKLNNEPPYAGYVIAAVLDEAGEDMILYADKVQNQTGSNVSFAKLPHYIERSDSDVLIHRE